MANERAFTYRNTGTKEKPVWERWFAKTVADAVLMSDKADETKTIVDFVKEYVGEKIAELIGSAPEMYDTLEEIADYIAEHSDVTEALNAAIGNKLDKTAAASSAVKWTNGRNVNGLIIDGTSNLANYGTCSTAAATAEKTVECTGFGLTFGAEITVKFTVTNTAANPTLNVGGTGAKPIFYRGAAIPAGYLAANRTYIFRYNGTQWELVGDINTDTTYNLATESTRGLVKIGYTANGKNYPVQLANEQMYVNVPWTDTNTTYSNFVKSGSGAKSGLVPAPSITAGTTKYLREDGTWVSTSTSLAGTVQGIPLDQTAGKALKDQLDKQNSNLSELNGKLIDKSGLNAVNKYTKPQTISHNNGISANAYNNSPLQIVSVYNNANWSRAQISFHNVGANAAILYLDVDGRLKVCDNGGNIHVLAYQ